MPHSFRWAAKTTRARHTRARVSTGEATEVSSATDRRGWLGLRNRPPRLGWFTCGGPLTHAGPYRTAAQRPSNRRIRRGVIGVKAWANGFMELSPTAGGQVSALIRKRMAIAIGWIDEECVSADVVLAVASTFYATMLCFAS